MDVELQILKHLKRSPTPTVSIIDRYCDSYNDLFSDVRNYVAFWVGSFPLKSRLYECFKYLHQGIISPIKRKSLPEIAQVVGISSPQSLHHFIASWCSRSWGEPPRPRCIANSPWSVEELKKRRLSSTKKALKGEKIIVVIDETGDRKKGKKTDYVARQ